MLSIPGILQPWARTSCWRWGRPIRVLLSARVAPEHVEARGGTGSLWRDQGGGERWVRGGREVGGPAEESKTHR